MKYSNLKIALVFVVAAALVFAVSAPASALEAKLSGANQPGARVGG